MPDPIPFTGATPTLPPEALMPPPGPEERVALAGQRQADGARIAALTLPPVRPRDFAARIRRRDMTSWRHQHRAPSRLAERAAGIAAIGALGLVLGAIGWGSPGSDAAAAQDRNGGLQPFERAGESFPGSAFYYVSAQDSGQLAPQDAARAWDRQVAAIRSDADDGTATPPWSANPAARPLFATGSSEDRWRALQCLTTAIYYEAASEPDAGQRAVAQVVLNRVAHPAFPKTVCGVVFQGSERPGCQFSFACDGAMARRPVQQFWDRARRVAADALAGNVFAPVGLATHYHTSAVHPLWSDKLAFIGTIGAHRFYRWAGSAGQPAAFNASCRRGPHRFHASPDGCGNRYPNARVHGSTSSALARNGHGMKTPSIRNLFLLPILKRLSHVKYDRCSSSVCTPACKHMSCHVDPSSAVKYCWSVSVRGCPACIACIAAASPSSPDVVTWSSSPGAAWSSPDAAHSSPGTRGSVMAPAAILFSSVDPPPVTSSPSTNKTPYFSISCSS